MANNLQELGKGLTTVAKYDHGLRVEEEASLKKLANSLDPVADGLGRLNTEHGTYLKATKGKFNVFAVLGGSGEETGLHSAFRLHKIGLMQGLLTGWGRVKVEDIEEVVAHA